MKTALIMEGGAMRGMFTCGVMDVLMENGIALTVLPVFQPGLFSAAISNQSRSDVRYATTKSTAVIRGIAASVH